MTDAPALWVWFVFYSGLSAQRAKALLTAWQTQGIALTDALVQPQSQATRLGLTAGEAALLASGRAALTTGVPSMPALTWRDSLYPAGLHALPLRIRPALLFYQGTPSLLSKPLVYLAPGDLMADAEERVRETLNLLLGEHILIVAFEGTPQAALAMEEMVTAEGEMLLFAQSGLSRRSPMKLEPQLTAQDRLVVVSPLPPETQHQAGLDSVLHQIAWYASNHVILTTNSELLGLPPEWLKAKPVLELVATTQQPRPVPWVVTADPTDVPDWLEGLPTARPPERTAAAGSESQPAQHDDPAATQETLGPEDAAPLPPLAPEEILKTLSQGGAIPDVLRQRILKGR